LSDNDTKKTLVELKRDSLEEAVEVLSQAFYDDPYIHYVLTGHENDFSARIRDIFGLVCEIYLEMELPFIGAMYNQELAGVACVSIPEKKKWPESLIRKSREMNESLGAECSKRMEGYRKLQKRYTPEKPHCYLAVLGIHPEYQGNGLARLLLDEVHEISRKNSTSTGVFLETAKLKNVDMYRHFGYNLISQDRLDNSVDLWYMFKPDNK
jgi:ribosomal protein S18 acetylase RimI-like enzyme